MAEELLVPRSSIHPVNAGPGQRYTEIDLPAAIELGVSQWAMEEGKISVKTEGEVPTSVTLHAPDAGTMRPAEFVFRSSDGRSQVTRVTYEFFRTRIETRMVNVSDCNPFDIPVDIWWYDGTWYAD